MSSLVDLTNPIFIDSHAARKHFETSRWPNGAYCPFCGHFGGITLHPRNDCIAHWMRKASGGEIGSIKRFINCNAVGTIGEYIHHCRRNVARARPHGDVFIVHTKCPVEIKNQMAAAPIATAKLRRNNFACGECANQSAILPAPRAMPAWMVVASTI